MTWMANEFSVIIEDCGDGWFWAYSPEVPAANGQGTSPELAKDDLAEAIQLVFEYLREKAEAEAPPTAIRATVRVGRSVPPSSVTWLPMGVS